MEFDGEAIAAGIARWAAMESPSYDPDAVNCMMDEAEAVMGELWDAGVHADQLMKANPRINNFFTAADKEGIRRDDATGVVICRARRAVFARGGTAADDSNSHLLTYIQAVYRTFPAHSHYSFFGSRYASAVLVEQPQFAQQPSASLPSRLDEAMADEGYDIYGGAPAGGGGRTEQAQRDVAHARAEHRRR